MTLSLLNSIDDHFVKILSGIEAQRRLAIESLHAANVEVPVLAQRQRLQTSGDF